MRTILWAILIAATVSAQTTTTLPTCTTTLPCVLPTTTSSTTTAPTTSTLATTTTTRTVTTSTVTSTSSTSTTTLATSTSSTTSTTRTTTTTTAPVSTTTLPANSGAFQWQRQTFSAANERANALAIARLPAVEAVIAGDFNGTMPVATDPALDPNGPKLVTAGLYDGFVSRYDAATGVYVCSRRFGGLGDDTADGVATDPSGNAIVGGGFMMTAADLGTSAGGTDAWVGKLDPSCVLLWAKRFGSTGADRVKAVKTDAAGSIYLAGLFQGTVDFGCGPINATRGSDGFVTKLDPNGACVWSHPVGGGEVGGLAVAPNGEHAVTGNYSLANFGAGQVVGDDDLFVVKYSPEGAYRWADVSGGPGFDAGRDVSIDLHGNVVVTGILGGDIFTKKWNATGTAMWSRQDGGTSTDEGTAVTTDPTGNVLVAGSFTGTATIGETAFVSHGAEDIFWLKLAPLTGATLAVRQPGVNGGFDSDRPRAIGVVDTAGSSILAGFFASYIRFGGTGWLNSKGYGDVFLLRVTP